jgi:hypothetical protein
VSEVVIKPYPINLKNVESLTAAFIVLKAELLNASLKAFNK